MIGPSPSGGAPFRDRRHAGSVLAGALLDRGGLGSGVVLALPRGGVPVAFEVATRLGLELDVLVVRKVGVPWQRELAMGAVAADGTRFVNRRVVDDFGIPPEDVDRAMERELAEAERRERSYRRGRRAVSVAGRPAVVVDDGLATGASMRAAVRSLHRQGATRRVIAVPAASRATCDELRDEVDDIVCAATPEPFIAVGCWYEDFSETGDAEVEELLAGCRSPGPSAS